jgi:hypothetical protein
MCKCALLNLAEANLNNKHSRSTVASPTLNVISVTLGGFEKVAASEVDFQRVAVG